MGPLSRAGGSPRGGITRRSLGMAVGAGWLADALLPQRHIAGRIVGNAHQVGHELREPPQSASPGPPDRTDVVIVGSGVSGLTAAWRLEPHGLDVTLLELTPRLGGTSAWGEDGVVPYPWGGHYVATPNVEARATLKLLADLEVVTGWDAAGRPVFQPDMLCHAPEERLFYRGKWHSGLVPWDALGARDRAETKRFRTLAHQLGEAHGCDGRPAFHIPFEHSSRDPSILELDRISMADWFEREGFRGDFVRWYAGYAMLDDFGAALENVSAWAALHYYGSRTLATPQLDGSRYLVWPAGNGWLVDRMVQASSAHVQSGALVTAVRSQPKGGVEVTYLDVRRRQFRRLHARAAILATPAFITRRIVSPAAAASDLLPRRTAAPWLVANLHVRRPVDPNLPWDSVVHGAAGLGYVHAGHHLAPSERSVITYYRAFGGIDVAAIRTALLRRSWSQLAAEVLWDLSPAHPELPAQTERLDVMIWGHGMPRPRPGFLGDQPFRTECALDERIAYAHVDQTGFALFEEANQRGVRAAETATRTLGLHPRESWL